MKILTERVKPSSNILRGLATLKNVCLKLNFILCQNLALSNLKAHIKNVLIAGKVKEKDASLCVFLCVCETGRVRMYR